MSNEVERILTAGTAVLVGIVGVAFVTAIVSRQSQSPAVIGSLAGGFACSLRTAITGVNQCGSTPVVNSTITFGGEPPTPTAVDSNITYGDVVPNPRSGKDFLRR